MYERLDERLALKPWQGAGSENHQNQEMLLARIAVDSNLAVVRLDDGLAIFAIHEYTMGRRAQTVLKGQDLLVLLKIAKRPGDWTYQSLASDLAMSASEVHASLKRSETCRLFDSHTRKVRVHALCQLIEFGVPYFFPAERMARTRGIPTAHSAEPLSSKLIADPEDVVVWPDPDGSMIGEAVAPLYRSAPTAAKRDKGLHFRLALVDALRIGKARDRKLAREALRADLGA